MPYLQERDRYQLTFGSLDSLIDTSNPVRFIDAFVDSLELSKLGFQLVACKAEGRPAYEPKIFIKLYFYGYLNGIRSSRKLERECIRNIELQWLLSGLVPNYHSISDFRKNNPTALKSTFKLFVLFLKDLDLVGGKVVAIDGTKVRASNSKKNNYNAKKIQRHLDYIDTKTTEYLAELEQNDSNESTSESIKNVEEKIQRLKSNRLKYELLQQQLEANNESQVSTTDPDSRALLVQGQVVEVCYNVQASVDQKHSLIVGTHTINRNDRNALSSIATETKETMQVDSLTVLVDKGYHNGRELQTTQQQGINTIVAIPELVNSNKKGTTKEYLVDQFVYDSESDTYTCPQGSILKTTGTWHQKTRERDSYRMKKYRTTDCKSCPVQQLCTAKTDGRREIERSEYAEAVEKNKTNYLSNKELYRKRQELNEHVFGTIKRQWGYNHTNLRGIEKVNGEMALIMTVYNIKRVINILGIEKLLEKLKKWIPQYPTLFRNHQKAAEISRFQQLDFYRLAQAA